MRHTVADVIMAIIITVFVMLGVMALVRAVLSIVSRSFSSW